LWNLRNVSNRLQKAAFFPQFIRILIRRAASVAAAIHLPTLSKEDLRIVLVSAGPACFICAYAKTLEQLAFQALIPVDLDSLQSTLAGDRNASPSN